MIPFRGVVALLLLFAFPSHNQCTIESSISSTHVSDNHSSSKRTLLSFIRKHRVVSLSTSLDTHSHRILYGAMLQLRCSNATGTVQWSKDGVPLIPNWRIDASEHGVLEIFPLVYEDSGRWECSEGGEFRGVVTVEVFTISDAFKIGAIDYLTTSIFFLPLLVIGIVCLSTRHLDPPLPSCDPIVDLITKQMNGTQLWDRLEDVIVDHEGVITHPVHVNTAIGARGAQLTIRAMLHSGP